MMSMNCFLMKSSIAMWSPFALSGSPSCPHALALLARGRKFLELLRGLRHLGFDPLQRQRSRSERAILEHQRRRRIDVVLLAEQRSLRDRRRAVTLVVGQRAGVEPFVPRLDPVWRAPDHRRLARGVWMQLIDRIQKCIDSHVVEALHL